MKYYTGLDVSLKTTAICIVNQEGKVVFETTVETDPDDITNTLEETNFDIEKVAIESGSISHWLEKELFERGLPIVCVDAHKMSKLLTINTNKTDKNDARMIAEALRCNFFSEVQPKTEEHFEIQTLLHCRRTLVKLATQLKNGIRGHLKGFGIFLSTVSNKKFYEKVSVLLKGQSEVVRKGLHGLLETYSETMQQLKILEEAIEELGKDDEDVKLLMTIPGVGTLTALSFKVYIGDPTRFIKSRAVGAYFGMTPRQYSSGETHRQGRVSKRGSSEMRFLLNGAATSMLYRNKSWSRQKAWGLKLKKKKGHKKASMALGRKLGILMHRMLITRRAFEYGEQKEIKALKAVA